MRTMVLFSIACLFGCGASFDSEPLKESGSGGTSSQTSAGGAGTGGEPTSNWSDSGHRRRKLVTIPELGNLTQLTTFVVPVLLDSDPELAASAELDGRDIDFTALSADEVFAAFTSLVTHRASVGPEQTPP